MERYSLCVNEREYEFLANANETLLFVLRERLDLTGAKCGCLTGDCGACTVLIDGEAKKACLIQIRNAVGHKITTIEGLSENGTLHPIQKAFIYCGAIQCGFCTPGMILSAKALLDKNLSPTESEIRDAISGNLCRCTGYERIVEAILLSSKMLRGEDCDV
ncbi:MAG: (2Fe-2S)-binding protein [Lachnospiraceae bacterium]|nr:(2Fe-2S)-binding protein [Lachnospiraceae bacterium]